MRLILTVKNQKDAVIALKKGGRLIDEETLTISQGFDTLLITAIDNILLRNRISKLSVKSLIVSGQMGAETSSFMVASAVSSGIGA